MTIKTAQTRTTVGGLVGESFLSETVSLKKQTAFSVAEAMIALLIGTIILGFSAPMITKQLKHNNLSDIQADVFNRRLTLLQNEIRTLRNEIENIDTGIPSGTIAFFNLATCPDDWSPVIDNAGNTLNGFYPRIALENDPEIGTTKEQMVHKHKHVSSQIEENNAHLYRNHRFTPAGTDAAIGANVGTYRGVAYTGRITYTNDGMNGMDLNRLTCPNRDEGNTICAGTISPEMALVGNENRPNSIVWLACERD